MTEGVFAPAKRHSMGHWVEYGLFRGVQLLLQALPLKSVQRLAAGLGTSGFWLLAGRRRIALDNLRHAFPELDDLRREAIARGAFISFTTSIFELMWIPTLKGDTDRIAEILDISDIGILSRIVDRGKGVVGITGHYGNWELAGMFGSVALGQTLHVVVQTQNNELVDEAINRVRTSFGSRAVPMGVSVREIVKALAAKQVVALAADQSGVQEGPFVNFFGRSVATHQGPAVFALRVGAPIALVIVERKTDGRYKLLIEEIPTDDISGGATEANIRLLTQRHVDALERRIRMHPDQWHWIHRRWKHLEPPQAAGPV